jgi:hypothetical protein
MLITLLGLRDLVKVIYGDCFSQDLSDADVATCYLPHSINNKLEEKFKHELASCTRVVSNTFTFSNHQKVRQDG